MPLTAAAAAGDPRVPGSSSQGTGPAAGGCEIPYCLYPSAPSLVLDAGVLCAVAGEAPAAPGPAKVRVIDLTGEVDDDAPTEIASVRALQQSATVPAEAVTAAAADAMQGAPSEAGDTDQPPPAGAGGSALEKPPSPQSAPPDGQGAAGLGQAGGTPSDPYVPSGSQTVAAGSSSSAEAAFSPGAGELAGRTWFRITFDPSVFQ
ncbi:skin secretory protein xP2-like [Brachypodium distachyon]|uniref:skin secretory protein xP2-like n=1 Tax=Brachypodium distachyon TaxID=15368 RepID=UPI00052FE7DD|nr:skin secretory protein xP2-like [Brachypodium distachyon]|eukprot:XP_010229998.1 skin secretory protein xP2-like [Brachypodium distachyon]